MPLGVACLELELEQLVFMQTLIRQEFFDDVDNLGCECGLHVCDAFDIGVIGIEHDVHIWRLVMLVRQQRREHLRAHSDESSPVGANQANTHL